MIYIVDGTKRPRITETEKNYKYIYGWGGVLLLKLNKIYLLICIYVRYMWCGHASMWPIIVLTPDKRRRKMDLVRPYWSIAL